MPSRINSLYEGRGEVQPAIGLSARAVATIAPPRQASRRSDIDRNAFMPDMLCFAQGADKMVAPQR